MKTTFKHIIFAGLLTIATAAQAQNSVDPTNQNAQPQENNLIASPDSLANKYASGLIPAVWSLNIFSLNPKFQNYAYASVIFNTEQIKIKIVKKMTDCKPGMMCPQVMPEPEFIALAVAKTEKRDCWDIYYAKTADNVKASSYEQIVLQRFASERCQTIASTAEGHLHYRVTGSNGAGAAVQADAHFVLKGVRIVEE